MDSNTTKPKSAALRGWRFFRARPGAEREPITTDQIDALLRPRDIYALCEHGQISHAGWNYFSEVR